MKFNYFKELISSALLCALCVKGCNNTKSFATRCITNPSGQIIELELKNNAVVEAKYFSSLTSIEKLTISGEQKFIQQSHFNEIATSTTLKEIHLTYVSASSTNIDMTVLKKNKNLSYLEVSDSCAKHFKFAEMTNIKELNVSKANLTQKMVNDIARIPRLSKMHLCLDNKFNKLDIRGIKSKKTLTSVEFNYKESSSAQYTSFSNTFKGFTNVKEMKFNSVKLNETDIKAIAGLNQVQSISFNKCNLSNAAISPFNNLKNLHTFELKEVKNVKGETLTNASLQKTEYNIISNGNNNFCMNNKSKGINAKYRKLLKPCSGSGSGSASSASFISSNTVIKVSTNGKCGARHGKCPTGQCCGKNGRCGKGTGFCGKNCLIKYGRCNHH